MVLENKLSEDLKRLWRNLSKIRRLQFFGLLFAMVVMSFLELLTLASVVPFLGVLTVPDAVFNYEILKPLLSFLDITSSEGLLFPATLMFCITAIISGAWRLTILWVSIKYAYALGADFGSQIITNKLQQPYISHLNENSGELVSAITLKINHVVNAIVFQILAMLVSTAIASSILIALFVISYQITIFSVFSFGLIYIIIFRFEKQKLLEKGDVIATNATKIIKILNESLGNIKDIILDSSQKRHITKFKNADVPMRNAQAYHQFVGQAPRYAIEALGIVLISTIAYLQVTNEKNGFNIIPILGTFALGAQRLLPATQQIFAAITSINGGRAAMRDLLVFLEQKIDTASSEDKLKKLAFKKQVEFRDVSFSFNKKTPNILNNVSFVISAGDKVGFIGETGSGKSTILDILMGLLRPSSGSIFVDDYELTNDDLVEWKMNVAHVPQSIFLFDGTVEENITLNERPQNNSNKSLLSTINLAQLTSTVSRFSNGVKTLVGERGARLSGGEIQRIGVARAIYKDRQIIVLDEATSALDSEVEKKLMGEISKISKKHTIIMVAHRVTTLLDCNKIYLVKKGAVQLLEPGTLQFNQLMLPK
jgi:ATP-binding cassette, subfamily B, bacterial PglK